VAGQTRRTSSPTRAVLVMTNLFLEHPHFERPDPEVGTGPEILACTQGLCIFRQLLGATHFACLAGQMEFWCIAAFVLLARSTIYFQRNYSGVLRFKVYVWGSYFALSGRNGNLHKHKVHILLEDQLPVTVCLFALQPQGPRASPTPSSYPWTPASALVFSGPSLWLCKLS